MADSKEIVDEAPTGGKKKLIIIVAAGVLLMLLGAGGATFFLLGSEQDSADGETAAQEQTEEEQGDPVYHKLDPVFVVTLPPGGPAGMLQVAIEVMTRTPTAVDTLKANDPMIRHHLLNLLEQQQAQDLLTVGGKQQLQTGIHELLNTKLEELQEPGDIKGVFFTQFVMQ